MRAWLKKWIEPILPLYAVIPLLSCVLVNNVMYFLLRILVEDAYHYDFTSNLDRMVPFVPAWVSFYILSFPFWLVNYILIGRQDKEHLYRVVSADIAARLLSGIFFVLLPTTNVRPEITGSGIWDVLMEWIYKTDAPTNLFPSFHCLTSWVCYLGIRGRKNIPAWYQWFTLVFCLLIFASTQFTKQHYLIDIFGGVALIQITWFLSGRFRWNRHFMNVFQKISGAVFGKENV